MRGHAGLPLPVMRALTLGSAARDRLFDLLEGKEVQTEDEKGAERVCQVERKDRVSRWRWKQGAMELRLRFHRL